MSLPCICLNLSESLLLSESQIRQERPGHGAPGLQDCCRAKGQPVIHSHPGGLLEAGEVCMDQ